MTYSMCEDAPCCGCCGVSVYGPAQGYYDEHAEAMYADPMESDYDPFADADLICGECDEYVVDCGGCPDDSYYESQAEDSLMEFHLFGDC